MALLPLPILRADFHCSPVYGVIFLFKYPTGENSGQTPNDGTFDYNAGEAHFFAAQRIQNACGTQALLSVLLNQKTRIDIGPKLRDFKEFTSAFPPDVCLIPHDKKSCFEC